LRFKIFGLDSGVHLHHAANGRLEPVHEGEGGGLMAGERVGCLKYVDAIGGGRGEAGAWLGRVDLQRHCSGGCCSGGGGTIGMMKDLRQYLKPLFGSINIRPQGLSTHDETVRCCCSREESTCHMSHVTYHMSHVTCHMSHVTCHTLLPLLPFLRCTRIHDNEASLP